MYFPHFNMPLCFLFVWMYFVYPLLRQNLNRRQSDQIVNRWKTSDIKVVRIGIVVSLVFYKCFGLISNYYKLLDTIDQYQSIYNRPIFCLSHIVCVLILQVRYSFSPFFFYNISYCFQPLPCGMKFVNNEWTVFLFFQELFVNNKFNLSGIILY